MKYDALVTETKKCFRCEEVKPFSGFKPDKRMADGHHSWCIDCWRAYHRERYRQIQADPEKKARLREQQNKYSAKYRKADPAKHNGYSRKYRQGIDQQAYEALLASQNGLCAIEGCGRPGIDVDHDHACCSGKRACGKCVRGILCHPCNLALGNVKDSTERLRGLARYLEEHGMKDVLSA